MELEKHFHHSGKMVSEHIVDDNYIINNADKIKRLQKMGIKIVEFPTGGLGGGDEEE